MSLPVVLLSPKDYNTEVARALQRIHLFALLSQRRMLTNVTASVLHFAGAEGPQCIQITAGALEQVKNEILQKIQNTDVSTLKRIRQQLSRLPSYRKDVQQSPLILPLLLVKDRTSNAVSYIQKIPKFDELFRTFLPSLARIKSQMPLADSFPEESAW